MVSNQSKDVSDLETDNQPYIFDSQLEELQALSICIQHLSKEAESNECFSAASYLLLAAEEIHQVMLSKKKNGLSEPSADE